MKRVIIIGAGASGLMSGIAAAKNGAKVTILEANEKPGKKLLITGNGRCNLTNSDFSSIDCYRGADPAFAKKALAQFDQKKTLDFFEQAGLLTREKNGGIYPVTDQAQSVLDVLLLEAQALHIRLKYQEKAEKIWEKEGIWCVQTGSWCYEAEAVILACGSKASPACGADGSGYKLAEMTGHRVISPMPALVPLISKDSWIRKLAGIRSKVQVLLEITNSEGKISFRRRESGELQWTEYGISGIVIFQLSRYAVQALAEDRKVKVLIDLLPEISEEKLCEIIRRRENGTSPAEKLTGILPKKMIPVILELSGISAKQKKTETDEIEKCVHLIKHLTVNVTGSKSFEMAQICMGGVDTSEINPDTMESRLHKNLYFTGEMIDIDGMCGGYNLQWAWSSGYTAGVHCSETEETDD